jgi:hypothetical protein
MNYAFYNGLRRKKITFIVIRNYGREAGKRRLTQRSGYIFYIFKLDLPFYKNVT